jgi:RHS repeat-associated protein
LDEETGNYYYRSRYYDSTVGRFISEDRIGFEGGDANLYRYVFNSPVNYTDPTGLQTYSNTDRDSNSSSVSNDPIIVIAILALFQIQKNSLNSDNSYDSGRSLGEEAARNADFDIVSLEDISQGTPPFVSNDPSLGRSWANSFPRGDERIENMSRVPHFPDLDLRRRVEVEGFPICDKDGLYKSYFDINEDAWGGYYETAQEIAYGHAWKEHFSDWNQLGINNQKEFANYLEKIMESRAIRKKIDGRKESWLGDDGTIVISNPASDPSYNYDRSTAFNPDKQGLNSEVYFNRKIQGKEVNP